MSIKRWMACFAIWAAIAATITGSRSLRAQCVAPEQETVAGNDSLEHPVIGRPYTATEKSTVVRRLANGATLTREFVAKRARDSCGRYMWDINSTNQAARRPEGASDLHSVTVFDPANGTMTSWSSSSRVATVIHQSAAPAPSQKKASAPPPPSSPTPAHAAATAPPRQTTKNENLGTRTIDGVEAEGTRSVTLVPAGAQGNDQPFTTTYERWLSPELGIEVFSSIDTPISGMQVKELTDIQQGEPDPVLFQPPQGYTIKEQYQDPPG